MSRTLIAGRRPTRPIARSMRLVLGHDRSGRRMLLAMRWASEREKLRPRFLRPGIEG